jgi:pyruvate kinase
MTNDILVTLGPISMNEETVKSCTELGVYVFRINLSHTPLDQVEDNIKRIQSWTDVPVCLDSEGAQLRNGSMVNEKVEYTKGDEIRISLDPIVGDSTQISFNPLSVLKQFEVGDIVQVDFNHVSFEITSKSDDHYTALVVSGGAIGSNKAADINRDLKFDPLTIKDRQAIEIGLKNNVKIFAMSFANLPEDVDLMRNLCGSDARIICKIESPSGVNNLESIIERTDEILIDRGDLSRRVPIERIPFLQRRIISTARRMDTPVFVATNLLESMVTTRSPTRAEVNDVVSTLEMGANGLVLAAETAIGKYPVEAVKMIRSLMNEFERWTPNTSISDLLREN